MKVYQAFHDGSIWGNDNPDAFVELFPQFKPLLKALRDEQEWDRIGRTAPFFVEYGKCPSFKLEIKASNADTIADLHISRAAPPTLADVKARVSLILRAKRIARSRARSPQPA